MIFKSHTQAIVEGVRLLKILGLTDGHIITGNQEDFEITHESEDFALRLSVTPERITLGILHYDIEEVQSLVLYGPLHPVRRNHGPQYEGTPLRKPRKCKCQ